MDNYILLVMSDFHQRRNSHHFAHLSPTLSGGCRKSMMNTGDVIPSDSELPSQAWTSSKCPPTRRPVDASSGEDHPTALTRGRGLDPDGRCLVPGWAQQAL
jgi:hypothetical protein